MPGVTPEWFKVAGIQPVVRRHESQLWLVGMWPEGFPVAMLPLWQVEQVPGVPPDWLNVAGIQPVVRWHESQLWLVGTCPEGFPVAMLLV